ncbi:hypothetical protein CP03DC29_0681B, partial [Chlamydia psittaci 03DC29]
IFLKGFING